MENENNKERQVKNFTFLTFEDVEENFAELNIELLRGRHVQKDAFYSYKLLKDYFDEFHHYYKVLYRLELVKETKENISYYYLDYPGGSKGVLSDQSRHKKLTQKQTLTGLILLNMYYERYFERNKEIRFEDIKKEVKSSENSTLYKQLFFGDIREDYSEQEWKTRVILPFKSVLRDFNKMGWIKNLAIEDGEEIHFEIKEPIYRFQQLYENEIMNFSEFTEKYTTQLL